MCSSNHGFSSNIKPLHPPTPTILLSPILYKESKLSDNEIAVVHYQCIYLKKVNYLQVRKQYIVNIR